MKLNKIHCGDWVELSKQLNDESIDMIMTSPPYWGLRDYGIEGQIGLEEHPNLFIKKLVEGFAILKKKLKKTGSLYLNLGDTYFGSISHSDWSGTSRDNFYNIPKFKAKRTGEPDPKLPERLRAREQFKGKKSNWLQPKQLMLMPSRVAIAMQEDGWILRNDIIWHKPNPMPSSVKDRLNTTFEHVFHFVKSRKYYYDLDAIREKRKSNESRQDGCERDRIYNYRSKKKTNPSVYLITKEDRDRIRSKQYTEGFKWEKAYFNPLGKNPGDFWEITTQPFPAAHFATYPEELCIKPIKSSCPKDGIVLDPFAGSGTTLFVAKKLRRNYVGFELSKEYIKIAEMRLKGCANWQYKESKNNQKLCVD